jgi:hypothetical protein
VDLLESAANSTFTNVLIKPMELFSIITERNLDIYLTLIEDAAKKYGYKYFRVYNFTDDYSIIENKNGEEVVSISVFLSKEEIGVMLYWDESNSVVADLTLLMDNYLDESSYPFGPNAKEDGSIDALIQHQEEYNKLREEQV